MDRYTVYKHTSPTNKVYIGITKNKKARNRWKYGHGYKHNAYFYNAIKKYGWNNIKHEILATNLTLEEASIMEKELIALYKNKGVCYNIAEGGTDGNTQKRTEEEKQHLSDYFKEYWKTHENPFKGKHHKEDSLAVMREKNKKRWKDNYAKMYAQVIVKVRIGVFNILTHEYQEFASEKEAAESYGISETTFRRHVNNGSIYKNFIFIPIDTLSFEEALIKAYNREKMNIHCGGQEIAVVQLTLDGQYVATYPSIKQAAIETGLDDTGIGESCRGNRKQSSGYFWMFESKYLHYKEEGKLESEIKKMKEDLNKRKEIHGTYILQSTVENIPVEVYISGKSITRKHGFDSSTISKCCRGIFHKMYGYKWEYITKEEYEKFKTILAA